MPFLATLAYELHPQTEPDAAKLLRAELVGRRWQDRKDGQKMPANCLWMPRTGEPHHTTDDLYAACADNLYKAVAAVAGMGREDRAAPRLGPGHGLGHPRPPPGDPPRGPLG